MRIKRPKAGLKSNMFSNRKFEFRPVLTICAALGMAMLIALGSWQVKRLQWKLSLIEKVEQRLGAAPLAFDDAVARAEAGEDMEYVPVHLAVNAQSNSSSSAKVFGAYEAVPGYFYFAPLNAKGGHNVYVNFGFVPQSETEIDFPDTTLNTGITFEVVGLFRSAEKMSPPASWFRSVEQSVDGLWFVRDPTRFAESAGVTTVPFYIDSFAIEGRDWPKGGTTRLDFNNRHLEYALTWYGLAATLMGVWLAFSLPKR